jgi:hypothetical protein
MPIAGISLGTGLGGGTAATISGSPAGGAANFNINVRAIEATILARTGDETGVIAFGTDTLDLYVYDGMAWQIYENA